MASPGRVQTPELNLRPSLRPAPMVDVAPVRPVNQEGAGNNLLRIADSLASFGNSVVRYGASQPKPKEEKDFFPDIASGWTTKQLVDDPRFDTTKDGHRALFGENFAHEQGNNLQQALIEARESGDWNPEEESVDDYLQRRIMADMEGLPDDLTKAAYGKTIAPYLDKTKTWFTELQTENQNTVNSQEMYKGVVFAAEEPQKVKTPRPSDTYSTSTSPPKPTTEDRASKAKAKLDEYIELRMLDGKTANTLLMNTIQYYADQGDTEMVQTLAGMRRGKNNEIDPLGDTPEYIGRINELISKSNSAWEDKNTALTGTFNDQIDAVIEGGTPNQLTLLYNSEIGQKLIPDPSARAEALRTKIAKQEEATLKRTVANEQDAEETSFSNDVWSNFIQMNGGQNYTDRVIKTSDGKTHTINGNKAQEFLDQNITTAYENAAKAGPQAVAAVDKDIARRAGHSSLKVTEWENVFSGVLMSANSVALMEGKVPPKMQRAYELWKNTKGHENVRRKSMGEGGDKVDDFFATVEMLERSQYATPTAMQMAFEASNPNKINPAIQRVGEIAWGSGSSQFELREKYPAPIADQITRRAAVYGAASGMNPESAVKKAVKEMEALTVKIDIGPTSYVTLPSTMNDGQKEQFKDSIETFVTNQVEMHGAKQNPPVEMDNIGIVEVADGKFQLMDDGDPIDSFLTHRGTNSERGVQFFTYEDIQNQINFDVEASKRQATADTVEANRLTDPNQPYDKKGRSVIGAFIEDTLGIGGGPPKKPKKYPKIEKVLSREDRITSGMSLWGVSREEAERALIERGVISKQ